MTSKNKNLVFLLIGALLLFSFKSAKKSKGSIIISPLEGNNLYALPGKQLYGEDPTILVYTFNGGELLTLIQDTGIDYKVSYIKPGGKMVTGYINYYDTETH
jgi:hypothetical protein